jgi:ABC-type sugar transport system permease subunit
MSDGAFAAAMFVPGAIFVIVLVVLPIALFLGMSLFRIELAKDDNTPFVALGNFLRIGADDDFVASIPRTIVLGFGMTAIVVPLSLATALLLNRSFRGASIVGVLVLLPWAIAPVVTGSFWAFIFNSHFGIATGIAMALGLTQDPIPWLIDSNLAMLVAVLASAWRVMPLFALLLLASLKTIPAVHYRAAKIDGATSWQAFRYITMPAIRNSLAIIVVLSIINSLQLFDILFLLTGGGPGRQTTVMTYYIYLRAFSDLSLGYSSALAVVLLAVIVVASSSLLLLRFRRRRAMPISAATAEDLEPAVRLPIVRGPGGRQTLALRRYESDALNDSRRTARIPGWVGRIVFGLGVVALLGWLLLPILWIAIASLQPESAVTVAPPALQPTIDVGWYQFLLSNDRYTSALVVSTVLAVSVMAITLVLASLAAYPLARYQVPHAGKILGVLIFTQMVPEIVLLIPVLLLYDKISDVVRLRDTIQGLIIINVAFWLPLIIWLLRNYFSEVPRSIEQSARIDGCSRVGTLFRVTIPAARSGIAAVAIVLLIGTWNEFQFAIVLGDTNAVTITRRITDVQAINPAFGVIYTEEAAAGMLAALIPLILVILFNRRLVRGLTEGFGKG